MERRELQLVTSALAEQFDATSLPAYWAHGDFAPWNIRHSDCRPPTLVDWEMGERGALPLQDAFHFLHIQRFLFRGRETSHSTDLAPFAAHIGITPYLCRKLEIAYLTRSYFNCMEWGDNCRAKSLLKSLAVVMRERARSTMYPAVDRRLRLVTSRPPNHRAARFEFFRRSSNNLTALAFPTAF